MRSKNYATRKAKTTNNLGRRETTFILKYKGSSEKHIWVVELGNFYRFVYYIPRVNSQFLMCISQGFVISDWLGLDRITSPEHADYPLSVKLGILAGIDMVSHYP